MRLAYDRQTMRRFDVDGRLHVLDCKISKSNVCPYYGREIPGSEALGLEPDRIYNLYRDPVELERAAPTFANLQLLMAHIPVNAADPQIELTVGAVGTDVRFEAPYLIASLAIWTDEAIKLIESRAQAQLSCSYRYTPVMDAGTTPEGVAYDGRMCNIVGNHVALVEEGRAGPDVVVNDAVTTDEGLPVKYAKIIAALKSFLKSDASPVAVDAAIGAALRDAPKSMVFARVTSALRPFLQPDADYFRLASDSGVEKALDEEAEKAEDEEDDEEAKRKKAEDEEAERKKAEDEEAERKKKEADDESAAATPGPKEGEQGAALDAAIKARKLVTADDAKALADAAVVDATARINELHRARDEVKPLVGVVALDSAEQVYKFALDQCGVDITGVHASAYPRLVAMAKSSRKAAAESTPAFAADARGAVGDAIPGLSRFAHA